MYNLKLLMYILLILSETLLMGLLSIIDFVIALIAIFIFRNPFFDPIISHEIRDTNARELDNISKNISDHDDLLDILNRIHKTQCKALFNL